MNWYPLTSLNTHYLTSDGTNTGTRLIHAVDGADKLSLDKGYQIIKALSGKPYAQVSDTLLGRPVVISFDRIKDADHDSIVAIIQAYITSGTAIALTVTDAPYPDISSLNIVPDENPVQYGGKYQTGILLDVKYSFITA